MPDIGRHLHSRTRHLSLAAAANGLLRTAPAFGTAAKSLLIRQWRQLAGVGCSLPLHVGSRTSASNTDGTSNAMVDKLTQTKLRSIKERAASGRKAIQDELQSRPTLMAFGQQPATRAELAKT